MNQLQDEIPPEPNLDDKDKPKLWYDLSIIQALSLAVVIAVVIASAGVGLYLRSDNHKYDINRPGNKYNTPKLTITDDTAIDTSSPVDASTLSAESKMIQSKLDQLPPYGSYKDAGLSDGALGISLPKSD